MWTVVCTPAKVMSFAWHPGHFGTYLFPIFSTFFFISVSNMPGLHVFYGYRCLGLCKQKKIKMQSTFLLGKLKRKTREILKAAIFAKIICSEGEVNAWKRWGQRLHTAPKHHKRCSSSAAKKHDLNTLVQVQLQNTVTNTPKHGHNTSVQI